MVTQNSDAFLKSWSAQLQSQANTVRDLIGDTHWLSDGHHRESILRDLISDYLPANVAIGSGFVKPPNARYGCSNEIDILISDIHGQTHYYNKNGLRIIPPDSLVAMLEVKSKNSSTKLSEALINVCAANLLANEFSKGKYVWSGIAFFDPNEKFVASTMAKRIQKIVCEELVPKIAVFNGQDPTIAQVLSNLPACIFNMTEYVVLISESEDSGNLVVRIFNVGNLAPSIAIYDMLNAVSVRLKNGTGGDVLQLVDSQVIDEPEQIHIKIEGLK